jgi:hypothetical protein
LAAFAVITSPGITPGQVIDTANYDSGIMFSLSAPVYSGGDFSALIEEADNPAMTDADIITNGDPRLIGTTFDAQITAQTNVGDSLGTLGVVGTKRYVRISIVAEGVLSNATIVFFSSLKPELLPV